MAFCQKCGQQIEETVNNCPYCGALNASNPNAKQNSLVEKAKKLNPKYLGIFGVAVVAVVLVIIIASAIFGNGYEKAIDNFVDASMYGKAKAVKALAPKEVWEYIEEEYDVTPDAVADYYEEMSEGSMEALEEEYGKNIKVSYVLDEADEVDEYQYDEIKDKLKECGVKRKNIKKAVEVEAEMKIKGKEDADTAEVELVFVKIGGDWYYYEGIESIISLVSWGFFE
ncbi:MAG: zinc ribbon domain-containing protein [Clostridia bacterium]|nr:zinc ribbon domain-containing protein [Clostridia bacterium]